MRNYKNIDQYINQFLDDKVQAILKRIRKEIESVAPQAEEAIKYGLPTLRLNNKNLVHFGAFKNHIGFFPTPSPIVAFKKELAGYAVSKGAIQFPLGKKIPYDLIKKIVKYRVRELM